MRSATSRCPRADAMISIRQSPASLVTTPFVERRQRLSGRSELNSYCLKSARSEAVETIAERLRGALLKKADVSAWLMNVTDEQGVTVMVLSFTAARPDRGSGVPCCARIRCIVEILKPHRRPAPLARVLDPP
ncbi:DUF6894 family protein [Rhizobium leguminosarum]|uniref:DUF6894 family protein n=1 Tax=Rhizobium leguminosarum TaxID=384 RepID=UPI00396588AD